jgi:hypothetical protein
MIVIMSIPSSSVVPPDPITITCGIVEHDFSSFFIENFVFYAPKGRFRVIFIYIIDPQTSHHGMKNCQIRIVRIKIDVQVYGFAVRRRVPSDLQPAQTFGRSPGGDPGSAMAPPANWRTPNPAPTPVKK